MTTPDATPLTAAELQALREAQARIVDNELLLRLENCALRSGDGPASAQWIRNLLATIEALTTERDALRKEAEEGARLVDEFHRTPLVVSSGGVPEGCALCLWAARHAQPEQAKGGEA